MNQIVEVDVNALIKADWNYKTDGTEEQISKLMAAISEAGSCGVFAVREIDKDGAIILEVMDGNHRLEAVRRLGWSRVQVENFGRISLTNAIIITRQRNQNWFEDDRLKLANLFEEYVFPEVSIQNLSLILPESEESLESLKKLASADWNDINLNQQPIDKNTLNQEKEMTFKVDEQVKNDFEEHIKKIKTELLENMDNVTDSDAFQVINQLLNQRQNENQ